MKVRHITTAAIKVYIDRRQQKGSSNATINRELAALKRMFHLAQRCTPPKISQVPYIPMLREPSARKGFFKHEEFLALREALPSYLRLVVTYAYYTGWRRGEILNHKWDQVSPKEGLVRLYPDQAKNDEARVAFLNEELLKEMELIHSQHIVGCPYVFHRGGHPIKDFRTVWATACKKIGASTWEPSKQRMVPARLFHDFRRTAVRNMIRAGVHERVAMALSGHKTRSVFDRYNIVNEADLREAVHK
jgi:integrase